MWVQVVPVCWWGIPEAGVLGYYVSLMPFSQDYMVIAVEGWDDEEPIAGLV